MIELKKNKYADLNLMCGIDTVSIRTDQQPRTDSNGKLPDGVTDIGSSNGLITLKINPNKWCGDGIELYSFGDYCAAMRQILKQMQINHYYYSRMQRNPLLEKEFFSEKDLQNYVEYLCSCIDNYISSPMSNFAQYEQLNGKQIA